METPHPGRRSHLERRHLRRARRFRPARSRRFRCPIRRCCGHRGVPTRINT